MPIKEEALNLIPIKLKVDGDVIIDCINANHFDWLIEKSIEECIELADALIHHKKGDTTEVELAQEIADVFVQIAILENLFSKDLIQKCIKKKLVAIHNRSERITKKSSFKGKIGFVPPNLEE